MLNYKASYGYLSMIDSLIRHRLQISPLILSEFEAGLSPSKKIVSFVSMKAL